MPDDNRTIPAQPPEEEPVAKAEPAEIKPKEKDMDWRVVETDGAVKRVIYKGPKDKAIEHYESRFGKHKLTLQLYDEQYDAPIDQRMGKPGFRTTMDDEGNIKPPDLEKIQADIDSMLAEQKAQPQAQVPAPKPSQEGKAHESRPRAEGGSNPTPEPEASTSTSEAFKEEFSGILETAQSIDPDTFLLITSIAREINMLEEKLACFRAYRDRILGELGAKFSKIATFVIKGLEP
jgi:hypothetical protein